MEMNSNYYAVIIAGGSGTRLWPKSRKKNPKHLLTLFGQNSLLQKTFKRIEPLFTLENIYIITNKDHVAAVHSQLPEFPEANIIPEPQAKGTAMAMAVATGVIHKQNPEAVVFNLWADQMFEGMEAFQDAVRAALTAAQSGDYLVAIGVKPTFAHTGLGYIKIGGEMSDLNQEIGQKLVFKGDGFKEKPDLETAEKFFESREYLWNTGLYCWSASSLLIALEKYSPKLARVFREIEQTSEELSPKFFEDLFDSVENPDSIDYEVSEKADNILVIAGAFGWDDVGDWKVVYGYEKKDDQGNAVVSGTKDFLAVNAENNLIDVKDKLVSIVGLSDIVVIETEDSLLICNKNNTQDVKKIVEKLKADDKKDYL